MDTVEREAIEEALLKKLDCVESPIATPLVIVIGQTHCAFMPAEEFPDAALTLGLGVDHIREIGRLLVEGKVPVVTIVDGWANLYWLTALHGIGDA